MSMLEDPQMYVVRKPYQGREKNILTVFPSFGWVVLGTYQNKTGGLDCFPNTELTKKAFWYALNHFPNYNILLEGVIASTVFSTYADLFLAAQEKYPQDDFCIVLLTPPLETCLKRIQKRNGGKPIKEDLVAKKWQIVNKSVEKFRAIPELITVTWDNRGCMKKGKPLLIHQLEELLNGYLPPF